MIWVILIPALLGTCALVWLARRIASPLVSLPVTAGWIEELSADRYRPMMRLLASEDIEFLRSMPGFRPADAWRLRAQRSRIFRGYLGCISRDFRQVIMALKLILVQSAQDRPDLAAVLVRQQFLFALALVRAHLELLMYRTGFGGVDVTGLVGSFDGLCLELQRLVPATGVA